MNIELTTASENRIGTIGQVLVDLSPAQIVSVALAILAREVGSSAQALSAAPLTAPTSAAGPILDEDPVIPPSDMMRQRDRANVAAFIRIDGREWKGSGPTPLEPGCAVIPDVLAEFRDRLEGLRIHLRNVDEMERQYKGLV